MTIKIIIIAVMIATTIMIGISTSNVSASGPRLDYPSDGDGTQEENDCWVEGYDSDFAGKYDSDRAKECLEEGGDSYNDSWDGACEDYPRTEKECIEIMNNPVDIEDYEALVQENTQSCHNDGSKDSTENKPFNKDRETGCDEFGSDYTDGYRSVCQLDNTESTCELLIEGEERYCPDHPDIVACVDFLHNATNKRPEVSICAGMGDPRSYITCFKEQEPEKYCLNTNDPVFCKTIGDICDPDGFVRPEYPYCTTN